MLVAGCTLLALALGFVVGVVRWRIVERRTAIRRRVVVNMGDDAISGVLWARRGRLLVLRDAQMHVPGREATSMDGEIVIDRDQVQFLQAL